MENRSIAGGGSSLPEDPDINNGYKIVTYSSNGRGDCRKHQDYGWQPVNVVNRQAWQEIEKAIAASRRQVHAGTVSCLHYYMVAHQMTPSLLARYSGQATWKVRLHLMPWAFKRLGSATLCTYAELFQVPAEDLKNGVLHQPLYERY